MVRPASSLPRVLWTRERRGIAVLALLAWALPTVAWSQKVPVGPEFQVNTITTGYQGIFHGPAIASDAAGNFVVVWNNYRGYGGAPIISGQRFDSAGAPTGAEFAIASSPYEYDYYGAAPHVASDSAGNFVVVWESSYMAAGLGDTYGTGIVGKRYDSSGSAVGSEFLVNAYTESWQLNPKIASDSAGNFVVVWLQYADPNFISGRRFDSSGNAIGDEFQVSPAGHIGYTGVDEDSDGIEIASGPAGNFMVVWNEWLQWELGGIEISARAYDSAGNPIGNDFRVNSYTTDDQTYPGVAADGSGNFVVVWGGRGPGTWQGVFARRYDSTGGTMGTEFQVNAEPLRISTYANVKVAADATGSVVVVWPAYPRIDGRSFDSNGIPTGGDFVVTPQGYSSTSAYTPDLAAQTAGDFVVVWREMGYSYYGGSSEIFGQRIGEAGPFGCTPAPKTGCRPQTTGRGGSIVLKDKSPDTKDSVVWRWVRGSETDREDFGDPLTDTHYALCLYDASANPQPRLHARAPAGGICAGIYPCWKEPFPERLDYSDRDADPDGLRLVRLSAGPEGKARIQVRGKGANLDMPALPLVPPVTVQLQASNDECWKAEYEEFVKKNQVDLFRANPDAP